jgi:hypothetical protein
VGKGKKGRKISQASPRNRFIQVVQCQGKATVRICSIEVCPLRATCNTAVPETAPPCISMHVYPCKAVDPSIDGSIVSFENRDIQKFLSHVTTPHSLAEAFENHHVLPQQTRFAEELAFFFVPNFTKFAESAPLR